MVVPYALDLLVGQAQVQADGLPVGSHAPGDAQQVCLGQVARLSVAQVQGREGETVLGTGVLTPAGFQPLSLRREKENLLNKLTFVSVWPFDLHTEIFFLLRREDLNLRLKRQM